MDMSDLTPADTISNINVEIIRPDERSAPDLDIENLSGDQEHASLADNPVSSYLMIDGRV